MSEFAEGIKSSAFRDDDEQNTKEEIEKEEGSSQSEGTQGEDLLEAAAKAAAEAAAEQKRKQDLLSGSNGSPTQRNENGSPVNATIHTPAPYTNTELMSSYGASDFYPEDKCPEDDLADENPDDDAEEFNDPDENGMDVDEAEVDLEEKLAADELPPPLSQMSNMAANLLPDSNVKLEKLQSTRVAVAQFAENNMPNLVNGQPTDLATLQSAIYTLQQQQLIQLQILQRLQQQLMQGMAPSMSNLQAMMQDTQSLLPPIAAMAKLTPQVANTAPGSNLSPPSGTATAPIAPTGGAESRSRSPAAADRKPLNQEDSKDDQFGFPQKPMDRPGSPMSHLTKMVETGKYTKLQKLLLSLNSTSIVGILCSWSWRKFTQRKGTTNTFIEYISTHKYYTAMWITTCNVHFKKLYYISKVQRSRV